ncbi:hypothetical protein ACJIZ3_016769 [Penstemon smallii]|uniref:Uncharacterized protein n=1 Tax=Penstemon smallii TaxID=265156 RepID=A0ABD3STT9_9LAMI
MLIFNFLRLIDATELCNEPRYEIIRCGGINYPICLNFCRQKFGPATTVHCKIDFERDGPYCVCDDCGIP